MCSINIRSKHQAGFAYLAILFTVAIMGAGLALAGTVWHTVQQREKEADLLFIGDALRRAIASYYNQSPGNKRFPVQLADLVKDPRFPGIKRHLRRLYADPITGKPEWAVLRGVDGGIIGVRSLSEEAPLRRYFPSGPNKNFSGKARYADWTFVYLPGTPL